MLQRTIKENCNVLRFSNAEFEAGNVRTDKLSIGCWNRTHFMVKK